MHSKYSAAILTKKFIGLEQKPSIKENLREKAPVYFMIKVGSNAKT